MGAPGLDFETWEYLIKEGRASQREAAKIAQDKVLGMGMS